MKNIDDLDFNILKILSKDCRENKSNIAGKLKKSAHTIKKHIDQMEENGVIKNYGVQIDYEKLGYDIIALIELTISKGMMLDVERDIAHIPNIFGVYDITGSYDAMILARFKKRSELSDLVKEINSYEYVVRTNTHLILNIVKEGTYFTDLLEYDKT